MFSNIITPPDIIDNDLHTITVINCDEKDIELLYHACKYLDRSINVYLYRSAMEDMAWVNDAIDRSNHIVVNDIDTKFSELLMKENVFYYGTKNYVSPAVKINGILDYFTMLHMK